jgi:serine/threonine protein kinase
MTNTGSYTGKTIDRYEFQELIGTGAFGEVYKAFDKQLLRNVAIKATTPALCEQGGGKDHIIHEARIHARAEHANIVPIYDVLDYEQSVLIVMRLVKGEDLDNMLNRLNLPLNIDESLKIMHQLLWGMDYAHSKGIVHLDLKPGNIRVSLSGEALIMDFGVASMLEEQSLKNDIAHGTPSYMAPEQIKCSYMDARSDIYSLGVILYKMTTGHHPFEKADTIPELLKCHVEEDPVAPSYYIETLPEKFEKAILKALEKNPHDRYHSCREFAFALEHSLKESMQHGLSNKELRWDPRVAVYLKARIQLSEGNELISAETINLSASGANLRISSDISVGSKIGLELYVPNNDIYMKVRAQATVLWKDSKPDRENIEIGISLDEINNIDRHNISIFVRNLLLSVEQDELPSERTQAFP